MASKGADDSYVSLDLKTEAHYYKGLQIPCNNDNYTNPLDQEMNPLGLDHMQSRSKRAVSNPYNSAPSVTDNYHDYQNTKKPPNNVYYNSSKVANKTYESNGAVGCSPYYEEPVIDIYQNDYELDENKLNVYEEIPGHASEHRLGSVASIHSTSSVQPILESNSAHTKPFFKLGRRKGCLAVLIVVVILLVLTIAIIVGVITKSKGNPHHDKNLQFDSTEATISATHSHLQTTKTSTPTVQTSTLNDGTQSTLHELTSQSSPLDDTTRRNTNSSALTVSSPASTQTPDIIPTYSHDTNSMVIVDHPRAKVRLVGDSVTLCCQAGGSPAPRYYDWLKDGELLVDYREITNSSSSLQLRDLKTSDSGYYACKATNDYVSVVSDKAFVDIKVSDSFCSPTPEKWFVALPQGCQHSGQSVYNAGRCPDQSCRGSQSDTNNCKDSQPFCCGPVLYKDMLITCGNEQMAISAIKSCGCVHCEHTLYNIIGVAQSSDTTIRFSNGHIYLRNMSTSTNDRMTSIGVFRLNVQHNAHRLVVITENTYDRDQFYNKSSHIIHLPNTLSGPFYMSADVRYIAKSSQSIQSTDNFIKDFMFENKEQFVHLEIPGGNYYSSEDEIYNGGVELSSNMIFGTDMEAMRAAPGDFIFIGADGMQHYIMAYGLFAVEIKGTTAALNYKGSFKVTIDTTHIRDVTNTLLWRLGTSGYWHVEDQLHAVTVRKRKRRSTSSSYVASVSGIHDGLAWFAVAKVSDLDVCVTKIRVYNNASIAQGSQLKGAQSMVTVQHQQDTGMISMQRTLSDEGDTNGYCIMHPCSSAQNDDLKGYVSISYEGELVNSTTEQTNVVTIKIDNIKSDSKGPTYLLSETESCSKAPVDTHSYVSFLRDSCEKYIDAVNAPRSWVELPCRSENYRTWHGPEEQTEKWFSSCHMKIYAPGSKGAVFQVVNRVGQLSGESASSGLAPGQLYGIREDCANDLGVVCLQVKPGGTRKCDTEDTGNIQDFTNVTAYALTGTWKISDIDKSLKRKANILSVIDDEIISLNLYDSEFGKLYGIYCAEDSSPESARWRSRRRCLSGKTNDIDIDINDISSEYYAFKMVT